MVRFVPVIEHPGIDDPPNWPVLPTLAPPFIHLTAETGEEATGSVLWHLARYNLGTLAPGSRYYEADLSGEPAAILTRLIRDPEWTVPGGIAVIDQASGREITPGCCAGLDNWREWLEFEASGQTPWMGHEPDPWLEHVDNQIRIWSRGPLAEATSEEPFAIDVTVDEFRGGLTAVSQHLIAFAAVLRRWADRRAPAVAAALVDRFLGEFGPPSGVQRVSQN